jgi:hypothetical protein
MCRPCNSIGIEEFSVDRLFFNATPSRQKKVQAFAKPDRPPADRSRRNLLVRRAGLTLIDMLVATTITVVQIFAMIGETVNDSRAVLELNEQLRGAARRLQLDLEGATALMTPPVSLTDAPGYFEYLEGPVGVSIQPHAAANDSTTGLPDTAVIDFDDVLMLTTRSADRPFLGRLNDVLVESPVAEVAWFVRGGRLYRRVLLVLPQASFVSQDRTTFYQQNDISARWDSTAGRIVANNLQDLFLPKNRYAHPQASPFDIRAWGQFIGLPTLGETSHPSRPWVSPTPPTPPPTVSTPIDFLYNPQPRDGALTGGTLGTRAYEDVILDHVVGFDVKIWNPSAPVYDQTGAPVAYGNYVDLNSGHDTYQWFSSYMAWVSSTGNLRFDGFDNNNDGLVDNALESSPFIYPRGIQVKIRVREPDSRQVREVTLIQDFLPK